jgi:hypothetical protein
MGRPQLTVDQQIAKAASDFQHQQTGHAPSAVSVVEQLGRRCYAMEISPVYVDVCVRRWEAFTGKKAERIAAGKDSPENTQVEAAPAGVEASP